MLTTSPAVELAPGLCFEWRRCRHWRQDVRLEVDYLCLWRAAATFAGVSLGTQAGHTLLLNTDGALELETVQAPKTPSAVSHKCSRVFRSTSPLKYFAKAEVNSRSPGCTCANNVMEEWNFRLSG